jgi:hypothetical protein
LNEPREGKAWVTCKSPCFRFESFAERLSTRGLGFAVSFGSVSTKGAAHHAAADLLPFDERWKRAVHAHFVGITKKDRGNKWVNQIVQDFGTKFAVNKFRQRFLMGRRVRVPKYFAEQGIFKLETNQTRREQATRGEWRPVQLTVSQDVALRPGITRDKFIFQP